MAFQLRFSQSTRHKQDRRIENPYNSKLTMSSIENHRLQNLKCHGLRTGDGPLLPLNCRQVSQIRGSGCPPRVLPGCPFRGGLYVSSVLSPLSTSASFMVDARIFWLRHDIIVPDFAAASISADVLLPVSFPGSISRKYLKRCLARKRSPFLRNVCLSFRCPFLDPPVGGY